MPSLYQKFSEFKTPIQQGIVHNFAEIYKVWYFFPAA